MESPVFLVVCDTLSAFHTSMHSEDENLTPFLNKLAKNNIFAPYTYSNAPWTVPSHASIFSGEFPQEHGTGSNNMKFESESFVEQIEDSLGISNNPLVSRELGFDRGFDDFIQGDEVYFKSRDVNFPNSEKGVFGKLRSLYKENGLRGVYHSVIYKLRKSLLGDIYFDSGMSNSLKLIKKRKDDYSFFFLNLMEPHAPYKSHGVLEKPLNYRNYLLSKRISGSAFPQLSGEESERVEKQYNKEIKYVDKNIRSFYRFLESEFDDFTLIITSDHGESFGENGIFDHQYLISEKLIRVPLIIAGPNVEDKNLDSQVGLDNISEFLLSGMESRKLKSSEIKASYQGAINFYKNYSEDFDLEDYDPESHRYLINQSEALIVNKRGIVENTELDDLSFQSQMKSLGESLEETEISKIKASSGWLRGENIDEVDF